MNTSRRHDDDRSRSHLQRVAVFAHGYLKALVASVGLSILFIVVYGGCNWITSQRQDVGELYFPWERFIPFVPVMIVPYLSIDLFFVTAPFLCHTNRELSVFSKRIIAAILVAAIGFLLFPLRFAFDRPHASGVIGAAFDWFRNMDLPYNQLPSLHLALRTILAEHYAQHSRGFWRGASHFWFFLVGLSALLTYQHHLMDVVTGLALGVYCIYFIPETRLSPHVISNPRVAGYYAAGTLAATGLMIWFWPWGALLLWLVISLGIVAAAYLRWGSTVFQKNNGRLHWSARLVLGPCLLGQYLSLLYYRQQCRPWNEVTPNVWIGRVLNDREAIALVRRGVTAVLDLTAEFSEAKAFLAVNYKNIPILDLTAPVTEKLGEMAKFIDHESRRGIVYVHCKIGYSRTAAAVAAYLLQTGKANSILEAIAMLRQTRPTIVVRPEVMSALALFARRVPQLAAEMS